MNLLKEVEIGGLHRTEVAFGLADLQTQWPQIPIMAFPSISCSF